VILNIPLFAFGTFVSGVLALQSSSGTRTRSSHPDFLDHLSVGLLLVEAARDILAISVVFRMCLSRYCNHGVCVDDNLDFDAPFVGIIGALATAIVLLVSVSISMSLSATFLAGWCAIIIGSATYFSHQRINADETIQSISKVRL